METKERSKRRDRRSCTPEFKSEIVDRCRVGDRLIPEVARDFDPTVSAVCTCVAQIEIDAERSQPRTRVPRPLHGSPHMRAH